MGGERLDPLATYHPLAAVPPLWELLVIVTEAGRAAQVAFARRGTSTISESLEILQVKVTDKCLRLVLGPSVSKNVEVLWFYLGFPRHTLARSSV